MTGRAYRMTPLTNDQARTTAAFAGIQFDRDGDAFARTHWAAGASDLGDPPS